ncbi:MAG: hypothetical protein IBJ18_01675 [Phycisphaerales bacterium]|nr:hypothetical protein [Phycisphaerales bacterium]
MSERDAANEPLPTQDHRTPDEVASWNCTRCEYNLAGLAVNGACPECGLAIEESKPNRTITLSRESVTSCLRLAWRINLNPRSFWKNAAFDELSAFRFMSSYVWLVWPPVGLALWFLLTFAALLFGVLNPLSGEGVVAALAFAFIVAALSIPCSLMLFFAVEVCSRLVPRVAVMLGSAHDRSVLRVVLLYSSAALLPISLAFGLCLFPGAVVLKLMFGESFAAVWQACLAVIVLMTPWPFVRILHAGLREATALRAVQSSVENPEP